MAAAAAAKAAEETAAANAVEEARAAAADAAAKAIAAAARQIVAAVYIQKMMRRQHISLHSEATRDVLTLHMEREIERDILATKQLAARVLRQLVRGRFSKIDAVLETTERQAQQDNMPDNMPQQLRYKC
jgi:hypothetical protein